MGKHRNVDHYNLQLNHSKSIIRIYPTVRCYEISAVEKVSLNKWSDICIAISHYKSQNSEQNKHIVVAQPV
jgi:hypothetical protein